MLKSGAKLGLFLSAACCLSGCALQAVNGKTKFGPEYRDRVTGHEIRWTSIEQALDFKWDKDITTTVSYRRRDTDDGNGTNDNGVWFQVGYPLWKAPKGPDAVGTRLKLLEQRIAQLEAENTLLRQRDVDTNKASLAAMNNQPAHRGEDRLPLRP